MNAVEDGKVERVRFSKDGSQLQLTAVDGRRATVVLPNDPELVDTLAKNGVDISVRARPCAGAPWGVGGGVGLHQRGGWEGTGLHRQGGGQQENSAAAICLPPIPVVQMKNPQAALDFCVA